MANFGKQFISFSVLVNGRAEGGWIQPQRIVRQECPLGPLLFVLAVNDRNVASGCPRHVYDSSMLARYP